MNFGVKKLKISKTSQISGKQPYFLHINYLFKQLELQRMIFNYKVKSGTAAGIDYTLHKEKVLKKPVNTCSRM